MLVTGYCYAPMASNQLRLWQSVIGNPLPAKIKSDWYRRTAGVSYCPNLIWLALGMATDLPYLESLRSRRPHTSNTTPIVIPSWLTRVQPAPKCPLKGTYIAVEPFHLERYLDEQAFRYNNRATKDN